MAESKDYNDIVNELFLTEEDEFEKSYEEGTKLGSSAGNPDGYHMGYHRGVEMGRELGYYQGVVKRFLKSADESKLSEKIVNQLKKVSELIKAFPTTNSESEDIMGLRDTIRAQYKKACALLKISSNNPYETNVSF